MHEGLHLKRSVVVTVFEVQAVAVFWVVLVQLSAYVKTHTLNPHWFESGFYDHACPKFHPKC